MAFIVALGGASDIVLAPPIPLEEIRVSPPGCEVSGGILSDIDDRDRYWSFISGRLPSSEDDEYFLWSNFFPLGIISTDLYPAATSTYSLNDMEYQVPCATRKDTEVEAVECPDPFLSPVRPSSVPCVGACPISAFSSPEFSMMWLSAVIPVRRILGGGGFITAGKS